jgi:Flp pilus assembly protein TadG
MIKQTLTRFARNRRGAVMIIFALCLLPLVAMVALAIDYSFYAEAKSQIQLAADAAATHAVRTAAATYSTELNQTNPTIDPGTAQTDAVAAGQTAGREWFQAQVGQLITAYVPGDNIVGTLPTVKVTPTTNPTGFSASVQYLGLYPPFFNGIFHQNTPWTITGTSGAQAQYSYVQIMMMIDASQSMLIGATQADINTMSYNSVCMNPNQVSQTTGDNPLYVETSPGVGLQGLNNTSLNDGTNGVSYMHTAADGNTVDFTQVTHYGPNGNGGKTSTDYAENCAAGYQEPGFSPNANPGNYGYAGTPCAFACHNNSIANGSFTVAAENTTGQIPGTYSQDLYGLARSLGVKLRLDVVLSATEQVISSMISNEQINQQYSVGVYKFNTDVAALSTATQGTPSAGGDASYEATYNLSGALSAVQLDDWAYHPVISTTSFPPADTVDNGNTNFVRSMNDFYSGTATNGTALSPVVSSATVTPGFTKSNPLKDLFIVTDGMEDECGTCGTGNRVMGEMTGVAAENGTSSSYPAICKPFKNLGYTIYVLYVNYNPIPHFTYYLPYDSPTDNYTNQDAPAITNGSERQMNQQANITGIAPVNPSFPDDSPDEAALRACASTNPTGTVANPTYFYVATSASDISNAMAAMLANALSNAIRINQ